MASIDWITTPERYANFDRTTQRLSFLLLSHSTEKVLPTPKNSANYAIYIQDGFCMFLFVSFQGIMMD